MATKRNAQHRATSIIALEELFTLMSCAYIARKLNISRASVGSWLLRGVPFQDDGERAIKLEELSKGKISRYRFCPELAMAQYHDHDEN